MTLFDSVKAVLAQYASGTASAADAETHFHDVARSIDAGTLANGIAEAMRSNQTPPFAELVSQLFANASAEQKAGMLTALLNALPADQRAKFSSLIPGVGAAASPVSGAVASSVSPDVVAQVAQQAERHNPSVIDTMSAFYAQHPTLIKTLGSAVLMIAMRKIAQRNS